MADVFASLKRNDLSKLTAALTQDNKYNQDERLWFIEVDAAGNGRAVVRLLPRIESEYNEPANWVRHYRHSFKTPNGKWFRVDCPTTIGRDCPVCEDNTALWSSKIQANIDIGRLQKRKVTYYMNALIINDPVNPELNGKVKVVTFGKSLFDKIGLAAKPPFAEEVPIDPFHLFEGANFVLKARMLDGYRNYELSAFEKAGPIAKTDAEIRKIWESGYALNPFIDPSLFKSYDEIKDKFESFKERNQRPASNALDKAIQRKTIARNFDNDEGEVLSDENSKTLDMFNEIADGAEN